MRFSQFHPLKLRIFSYYPIWWHGLHQWWDGGSQSPPTLPSRVCLPSPSSAWRNCFAPKHLWKNRNLWQGKLSLGFHATFFFFLVTHVSFASKRFRTTKADHWDRWCLNPTDRCHLKVCPSRLYDNPPPHPQIGFFPGKCFVAVISRARISGCYGADPYSRQIPVMGRCEVWELEIYHSSCHSRKKPVMKG